MIKNSIVNVLGSIIPLAVALITVPLYLSLIGEERYGVLAVIWVLLGYFGIFDFGLGKATARQMSKIYNDTDRSNLFATVLTLIAILSVIGGGILSICSGWLLTNFVSLSTESKKEVFGSILWLPIGLMFLLLNSAMQGALQARERFVAINVAGTIGDSMAQLLPLFMAWMGWVTIDILLPSVLVARFLTSTLLFIQCKNYIPLQRNPKIDLSYVKPLLNYGGWASALTMIGPLLAVIDRLVIASMAGAKGVALFAIPYNLVTKLSILPNSFGYVLFPKLAGTSAVEARLLAGKAARAITAAMTPVIIFAIMILDPFMQIWLGTDFAMRCVGIAEILCLGVWIGAVVMPYSNFLYAEASQKSRILITALVGIPIYLVLIWVGMTYFGVMGAAAAWSLKLLIDAIIHFYLAKALHEVAPALGSFLLLLAAVFVAMYIDLSMVWRFITFTLLVAFSVVMHLNFYLETYRMLTKRRVDLASSAVRKGSI